ncbi:MAG TPA: MqnA/MqnD/SBP family protein, partial [Gemmatimonadota bacterium]|nr:MqnA/MqnD/SBP family protein [Gemmatimonadota bacterium]
RLDGGRIGVTGESSTSRRLLELLARAYWEIDVEWVPEAEFGQDPTRTLDGVLMIGDRALEIMADPDRRGWARAIDLASEWWAWQCLPFVFAVWVVRSGVARRDRARFSGFLAGALAVGLEHLEDIAAERADGLGSAESLHDYLRHITYRLGSAERDGMRRFRDLLADHDILEYEGTRA